MRLPRCLQTGSASLKRGHLHPWRSSPGSHSAKPSCPSLLPALDGQKNQRVCQERGSESPFKARRSFLLSVTIRADRSPVGSFLSFDVFLRSSLVTFLSRLVRALLESERASEPTSEQEDGWFRCEHAL